MDTSFTNSNGIVDVYDYNAGNANRRHDMNVMENRLDEIVKRSENLDGEALYNQVTSEKTLMEAHNRMNIYNNQNQAMKESARRFQDTTRRLGTYNEAYNSNMYIDQNVRRERDRVHRLAQMSKNDLHSANQTYLRENYKHQMFVFLSNLVMYTIIAMSLGYAVLSQNNWLTTFFSYVVFGAIVVAYALTMTFEVYRHSLRLNPYHWNRLYFNAGVDKTPVGKRQQNPQTGSSNCP